MSKEPVSRKQAEERLRYLKSELAHEGYHDGWTLKGMREEVEWLEKEFPQLEVKKRLSELNKEQYFSKKARKRGKQHKGRRRGGSGLR